MKPEIWQQQYAEGVPATVDVEKWPSLAAMFRESCERFADSPAYTSMGQTINYGQLEQFAGWLAAWMQARGIEKGDRVGLMMPNVQAYPVALFAALRLGVVVVSINPLSTARELRQKLEDSEARGIVILDLFFETLEEALPGSSVEFAVKASVDSLFAPSDAWSGGEDSASGAQAGGQAAVYGLREALTAGRDSPLEEPPVTLDDLAFLQYTGGTTGEPKGVMLTHGNLVANLSQLLAWYGQELAAGQRNVVVTALPLYHIFALTVNCLFFTIIGGELLLIANPRDFAGFVQAISTARFTVINGVNTLYNGLLNEPEFSKVDFSALRFSGSGGMATQEAVARRWKELTGCVILQGYGLSETSPSVSGDPFTTQEFSGSVGVPMPSTEISICDAEGNEVPDGELGEICVRGPQVMRGYWRKPEATKEAFFPDGWFRTGDIGYFDERGFLYISDRLKDMILVSGFNVYPNEVESVLAEHPGIVEAAVVGVDNGAAGEAVKAFVHRRDPNLTPEEVIAHCRKNLTAYKVPSMIEFREDLPKSPVGKILRRFLRAEG